MTTRFEKLASGLRVATIEIPYVESCALGVWVEAGSINEPAHLNGISHMLEHMAFKGTTSRTAAMIAEEIESVGGYLNAYTSRETTCYQARVLKEDIGLAIDLLTDILQNSTFDSAEFSREQDVIIQEINESLDTPDDIIFEYFQDICYPDQSLGRSILGTETHVRSFTPELVKTYMRQNYSFDNTLVVASGKLNHDDIVAQIEAKLQGFPAHHQKSTFIPTFKGGVKIFEKDLEQAHVIFGFEGVPYFHPHYYASIVYSTLMGGGMSSRLFQEIREKRGLAYTIYSFPSSYETTGQMGVYAATNPAQVDDLLAVVYDELRRLSKTVTLQEVERAKAQLRAGLMMGAESTTAICEHTAKQISLYGAPKSLEEINRLVEKVSLADVVEFSEFLLNQKHALAGHGPINEMPQF